MTEADGIHGEAADRNGAPSDEAGVTSVRESKLCPHCRKSLAQEDLTSGVCWNCDRRFTDVVNRQQRLWIPLVPVFLLALVGAIVGGMIAEGYQNAYTVDRTLGLVIGGTIGCAIAAGIGIGAFFERK